jgi:alkanesulfonate monooxygenase SsuD/methylene tetrahydromethanopterin reductase-like flavin-dependent oxidoreductase (luciferase family)
MGKRQLHLNVNLLSWGTHPAAWRIPGTNPFGYINIQHHQNIARIAERGLFDAILLADVLAVPVDSSAAPTWALDPFLTAAGMAAVTERIGFIATASTTFAHPFHLDRRPKFDVHDAAVSIICFQLIAG